MSFLNWDTPRTPRTPMTPFDLKYYELDDIKKDLDKSAGKTSELILNYQDWFSQQNRSFIMTLKSLEAAFPTGTAGIYSIKQLRHITRLYQDMKAQGRRLGVSDQTLTAYFEFWDRFVALKAEIDEEVTLRINRYVESVSRLRQVEVKQKVDSLVNELNEKFSEDYNFKDLRETGKLYTFSVSTADYTYQGLVTYLPHLMKLAQQVCFHSRKIHLEKE